jgi:hypothetical protein
LTPRRKVLIGLFVLDAILATAAVITAGVDALAAWIILNVVVIIPAFLMWRRLSKRSKGSSATITYPAKEEQQYGATQTTLRGEQVKSYGEKMLADYFFKSDTRYEYEQPAWSRKGRRISRPDFYLPDFGVYVEYWGMADAKEPAKKEEYVRSMKWKMAKYHQNGIKFISIYRENLDNLDWIFKAKLRDEAGIDLNKT